MPGRLLFILRIAGPDALKCWRELAQKVTAGTTLAGALPIAAEAPNGANILAMLPDTGECYLSTLPFADIPVDEIAISKSTPGCRMPTARKSALLRSARPITLPQPGLHPLGMQHD